MKKTIKLLTVVILLVAAIRAEASTESSLSISAVEGKKLKVALNDIQGKATSYIRNVEGEVLFHKRHKQDDKQFVYDVSDLDIGEYLFVLEDDKKAQSVPFEVEEKEVFVKMKDLTKTYFPKIETDDDTIFIKMLSNETNDLYIDIKSSGGELIFHEKLEGKLGLIGKRFKFKPGSYLLTLSSNEYLETKSLTFR